MGEKLQRKRPKEAMLFYIGGEVWHVKTGIKLLKNSSQPSIKIGKISGLICASALTGASNLVLLESVGYKSLIVAHLVKVLPL